MTEPEKVFFVDQQMIFQDALPGAATNVVYYRAIPTSYVVNNEELYSENTYNVLSLDGNRLGDITCQEAALYTMGGTIGFTKSEFERGQAFDIESMAYKEIGYGEVHVSSGASTIEKTFFCSFDKTTFKNAFWLVNSSANAKRAASFGEIIFEFSSEEVEKILSHSEAGDEYAHDYLGFPRERGVTITRETNDVLTIGEGMDFSFKTKSQLGQGWFVLRECLSVKTYKCRYFCLGNDLASDDVLYSFSNNGLNIYQRSLGRVTSVLK